MAKNKSVVSPLSPILTKVLDKYYDALCADKRIDNETVARLDVLLRKGKVPKFEDIDAALFPPPMRDKS